MKQMIILENRENIMLVGLVGKLRTFQLEDSKDSIQSQPHLIGLLWVLRLLLIWNLELVVN